MLCDTSQPIRLGFAVRCCIGLLTVASLQWLNEPAVAKSVDPAKPNIVLVIVDDMSWVGTSVLMDPNNPDSRSDYHQTPNLEQLAAEGMVFSNAYAAGPMCSPTRASLQTGMSPAALRVTDVRQSSSTTHSHFINYYTGYPLTPPQPRNSFPEATTIGEQLKANDPKYFTGFYGKWDWWPNPLTDGYDRAADNDPAVNPPPEDPKGIFSLTNLSVNFLTASETSQDPFFLITSFAGPKPNSSAKASTLAEFEALPLGEKHRVPLYAAEHKDMDEGIGIIMDKVVQMGVEDNTYFVFVSDNGAAIGLANQDTVNAPLFGGKGTVWEGGIKVPLIIRGPGITPATYSDVPVSTIDLLPTFNQLAGGAPMASGVEGASLLPVLWNDGELPVGMDNLSRAYGENGELYFHFPHYGPTIPIGLPTPASAIRDGNFKLVRVYGENGADDQLFLFDLSQSLAESNDPNSPLNLAFTNPQKVAELNGKLSAWLQGVDASIPYEVGDDLRLDWEGSNPRSTTSDWRSTQDPDFYDREIWLANSGAAPAAQSFSAFQPGIGEEGFHFNGTQGFNHRFIHVSDSRKPDLIDPDHSISLEFWVRLDTLQGEQMLFEAGSSSRGLSLTIGDGDGDGVENEIRFRVVDALGRNLTTTATLDEWVDPTSQFIQVAAVLNDSVQARHVELFINGHSVGKTVGIAGSNEYDWDSLTRSSIGKTPSTDTIGAASGTGDRPFVAGGLKGTLAAFRIENYAIESGDVLDSYNARLDKPHLGLIGLEGQVSAVGQRPSSSAEGEFEASGTAQVLLERRDAASRSFGVDFLVETSTAGLIDASTSMASYLVHFDPTGDPTTRQAAAGSIRFAGQVLGFVFTSENLVATDSVLGSIGAYTLANRGIQLQSGDFIQLGSDGQTVEFSLSAIGSGLAEFRVVTSQPLVGDFNGDEVVNVADYTAWRDGLGVWTTQSDYDDWRSHFGDRLETNTAAHSVPEPGAVVFASALVGVGSVVARQRYRRALGKGGRSGA